MTNNNPNDAILRYVDSCFSIMTWATIPELKELDAKMNEILGYNGGSIIRR